MTPSGTKHIHAWAKFDPTEGVDIKIYEGATTSNDGTPVSTLNSNRELQSTHPASLLMYATPTISTTGDEIWHAVGGAGRSVGVMPAMSTRIIAKKDTKYYFLLTKTASGTCDVSVEASWEEHEPEG